MRRNQFREQSHHTALEDIIMLFENRFFSENCESSDTATVRVKRVYYNNIRRYTHNIIFTCLQLVRGQCDARIPRNVWKPLDVFRIARNLTDYNNGRSRSHVCISIRHIVACARTQFHALYYNIYTSTCKSAVYLQARGIHGVRTPHPSTALILI